MDSIETSHLWKKIPKTTKYKRNWSINGGARTKNKKNVLIHLFHEFLSGMRRSFELYLSWIREGRMCLKFNLFLFKLKVFLQRYTMSTWRKYELVASKVQKALDTKEGIRRTINPDLSPELARIPPRRQEFSAKGPQGLLSLNHGIAYYAGSYGFHGTEAAHPKHEAVTSILWIRYIIAQSNRVAAFLRT